MPVDIISISKITKLQLQEGKRLPMKELKLTLNLLIPNYATELVPAQLFIYIFNPKI